MKQKRICKGRGNLKKYNGLLFEEETTAHVPDDQDDLSEISDYYAADGVQNNIGIRISFDVSPRICRQKNASVIYYDLSQMDVANIIQWSHMLEEQTLDAGTIIHINLGAHTCTSRSFYERVSRGGYYELTITFMKNEQFFQFVIPAHSDPDQVFGGYNILGLLSVAKNADAEVKSYEVFE